VGTFTILREQAVLKVRTGLGPGAYLYYELDDPAKSWEEKLSYIGGAQLSSILRLLNPPRYQYAFKNKVVFKHVFGAMGFPVAKLYGLYDPLWGRTAGGAPLRCAADIAAWMESSGVQEAVFKPMESAEGRMVLVVAGRKPGRPATFVSLAGEEYTPERLVAFLGDPALLRQAYPDGAPPRTMLVEERLHQHPDLAQFSRETLCCVRVATLATQAGSVEVIEAGMKIQPRATGVDNVAQGAVGVGVDVGVGVGLGLDIGTMLT
jgi:hypothetical protein